MAKAFLVIASAVLLVICLPQGGLAEQVSYSTPMAEHSREFSGSFTLPKFDPGLGTLTAIYVFGNSVVTSFVTLKNPDYPDPYTYTVESFFDVAVTIPEVGGPLLAWGESDSKSGTTPDEYVFLMFDMVGIGSDSLSPGDLSVFLAGSPGDEKTFDFDYSHYDTGRTPGTAGGWDIQADSFEVTYSYDPAPIPAPSTLVGLTGLGVMGLAIAWLRRR